MTQKTALTSGQPGTLYVVATPIGNPEDITVRALRVLGEVDWVAAEDTRTTGRMLKGHNLWPRLISFFEHNEKRRTVELIERLAGGESGALVSDAGTPTVSDPGYRLVRTAAKAGIPVVPVPGASAAAAAMSASGLPTDAFVFLGFPPKKPKALRDFLRRLEREDKTLIFYESPLRILPLLDAIEEVFSDRDAVLAREMTKPHEEFLRGRLSGIRSCLDARSAVKGECTLLVAGAAKEQPPAAAELVPPLTRLLEDGVSVSAAAKTIAQRFSVSKGKVYKMALTLKNQRSADKASEKT